MSVEEKMHGPLIPAYMRAGFPRLTSTWELYNWQNGRCAICGNEVDLVEDHCHRSGLVRGYLCHWCNTEEGHLGDEWLGLFTAYRHTPPAVLAGVTAIYRSGFGRIPEQPLRWVLKALGPVPEGMAERVAYLQAAAVVEESRESKWEDAAGVGLGF